MSRLAFSTDCLWNPVFYALINLSLIQIHVIRSSGLGRHWFWSFWRCWFYCHVICKWCWFSQASEELSLHQITQVSWYFIQITHIIISFSFLQFLNKNNYFLKHFIRFSIASCIAQVLINQQLLADTIPNNIFHQNAMPYLFLSFSS